MSAELHEDGVPEPEVKAPRKIEGYLEPAPFLVAMERRLIELSSSTWALAVEHHTMPGTIAEFGVGDPGVMWTFTQDGQFHFSDNLGHNQMFTLGETPGMVSECYLWTEENRRQEASVPWDSLEDLLSFKSVISHKQTFFGHEQTLRVSPGWALEVHTTCTLCGDVGMGPHVNAILPWGALQAWHEISIARKKTENFDFAYAVFSTGTKT